MTNKTRISIFAAGTLLLASVASAYVLLSPERSWESPPTYLVDNRGIDLSTGKGLNETRTAIESTDAWNGAGAGDVVFTEPGDMSGFALGDRVPMLNFEDPTGQCSGNCLAATFTGFYERAGRGRSRTVRIVDADIVTNQAYDWTSETQGCSGFQFFIEGVQVHEIGHGLGIGHTDVLGATMYPSVAACDNGPATTEGDDEAALCALYGCDNGGGNCTLGQAGDMCSANNQCCSGKCRGKPGSQTCR